MVQVDQLPAQVAPWYEQLTDPASTWEQRRQAAAALLEMNQPRADQALAAALADPAGPAVWQPLLAAVAGASHWPQALTDPLLALLPQVEESWLADWAAAVGRCREPRVMEWLIERARDRRADGPARRAAIAALGHQRTQEAAGALVALLNSDEPEAVQRAAMQALSTLSGIERPDADPQAWRDWWRQVKNLSSQAWQDHLVGNFAGRSEQRRLEQQELASRLVESQRALYRAASQEDRPAMLVQWLADPVEPMRQLAMDLAVQQLVDGQPFDDPLRGALRARLNDPSPLMRQRAALLLRDLADSPAADQVAQKLAQPDPQTPASVQRAYLLMMARMPRLAAIDPAIELLSDPALSGEAAGALTAAAEAGLMNSKQKQRAAKQLRNQLDRGLLPAGSHVALLGKVGEDEDWQRIAGWLEHEDAALRQAAARAWAESDRPLSRLSQRIDDPAVRPALFLGALRRGSDPALLTALAEHPPAASEPSREVWQRAAVAMAGRVPAEALVEAVARLSQRGESAALREQMLTAGIEAQARLGDRADRADLASLLLERAQVRLELRVAPPLVLEDYDRVERLLGDPTPALVEQILRGRIRTYLLAGQIEQALALAGQALASSDVPASALEVGDSPLDLLLDAAAQCVDEKQMDRAGQILSGLRRLLGAAVSPAVAQRIALLEASLAGATAPAQSPPPAATQPASAEAAPANATSP